MISLKTLEAIESLSQTRKTVKRKYKTKKGIVSKEYSYAKSELLFRKTKTGYKLRDKSWQKLEDSIRKASKTQAEAQTLINEARTIRQDILHGNEIAEFGSSSKHYASSTQKGWNRIDIHSMISRLATNSVEKYLINMGLSPNEVIEYVNLQLKATGRGVVDISELLNPGNWNDDTVQLQTSIGDVVEITIKFSYDGLNSIIIK